MKTAFSTYVSVSGHLNNYKDLQSPKKREADAFKTLSGDKAAGEDPPAVLPDLSEDARKKAEALKKEEKKDERARFLKEMAELRKDRAENSGKAKLDDPTARLTKRLVSAKRQMEVLSIMSEAYKALGDAIKAAAGGDKDAIEVMRRLRKLVKRINRKLSDLEKEDQLRNKEKRAKEKELEELRRQLELELKRKIAERKKREKKYLSDPDAQERAEEKKFNISFGSMSKYQLDAMIKSMLPAAVSTVTGSFEMGFSEASVSAGGVPDGGEASEAG